MIFKTTSDVDCDDWDDCYYPEGGEAPAGRKDYKDDIKMEEFSTGLGAEEKEDDGVYFKNPIMQKSRGCTDFYCVAIYWAFLGVMIYATYYGYQHGKVDKLVAPIDAAEDFCGFTSVTGKPGQKDMKDYPKMVFTNLVDTSVNKILTSGVCVKECPEDAKYVFENGKNCMANKDVDCPSRSYETIDFLGYCLPSDKDALTPEEKKGV